MKSQVSFTLTGDLTGGRSNIVTLSSTPVTTLGMLGDMLGGMLGGMLGRGT